MKIYFKNLIITNLKQNIWKRHLNDYENGHHHMLEITIGYFRIEYIENDNDPCITCEAKQFGLSLEDLVDIFDISDYHFVPPRQADELKRKIVFLLSQGKIPNLCLMMAPISRTIIMSDLENPPQKYLNN